MGRTIARRGLATALASGVLLVAPVGLAHAQEPCEDGSALECPEVDVDDDQQVRDDGDVASDVDSRPAPDAAEVSDTNLAATGSDTIAYALIGMGLIAVGGTATSAARRRAAHATR